MYVISLSLYIYIYIYIYTYTSDTATELLIALHRKRTRRTTTTTIRGRVCAQTLVGRLGSARDFRNPGPVAFRTRLVRTLCCVSMWLFSWTFCSAYSSFTVLLITSSSRWFVMRPHLAEWRGPAQCLWGHLVASGPLPQIRDETLNPKP